MQKLFSIFCIFEGGIFGNLFKIESYFISDQDATFVLYVDGFHFTIYTLVLKHNSLTRYELRLDYSMYCLQIK